MRVSSRNLLPRLVLCCYNPGVDKFVVIRSLCGEKENLEA